MKKSKGSIFFRYEFSNESGRPEGGDIFELSNMNDVQEMTADILKVAHSDNVAVNLTIGEKTPFYGFLKKVGMTPQDIEREMVNEELILAGVQKKPSKKKTTRAQTKVKSPSKPKSKAKSKTKTKRK